MKRHVLAITWMLLFAAGSASAVVFTNDTLINPLNTSYDGADIVVSNCVLTVDGQHNFASLRVAGTGVLTHTFDPAGILSVYVSVTNEPVLLNSTNATSLANSNVVASSVVVSDLSGTTIFTNAVDYVVGVGPDGRGTIQRTDSSSIPDGATVLVSYNFLAEAVGAGLSLNIAGNAEVEASAKIDVSGRGYAAGPGVGASAATGLTGSGAGHGGSGGLGASNAPAGQVYGFTMLPNELGSGGGSGFGGAGGIGGGLVKLVISANFLLDGQILASGLNGTNSRSGGGSGGSISVSAQTFAGSGAIRANGGAGEPALAGGGAGGRIAIDFATNTFSGSISAFGGAGWQRGGAGTILLRPAGTAGAVTFDNGGAPGATTALGVTNAPDLTIQGSAIALLNGVQTVGNLVVHSNSSVQLEAIGLGTLTLNVVTNATIDPGAQISMDARGYAPNTGPGMGRPNPTGTAGSGAGHGGNGGLSIPLSGSPVAGGLTYDTISTPTIAGSGGYGVSVFAGGTGGGVIRLTVTGNLQLNGRLSADATAGAGSATGGGAGGSIWLILGGLSGTGIISANGGAGGSPYGGGGGGGRIAVSWTSNTFTGSLQARGGPGIVAGGAGTIYTRGVSALSARLVADNGGVRGTNTDFNLLGVNDALISGGATATSSLSSVTLSNLVVGSNGTFLAGQSFTFNTTNLVVNAGGAITLDGASSSTVGSGGIGQNGTGSGGAGHGGFGGNGSSASGGAASDTAAAPSGPGSRGGFFGAGPIPYGGGALRINAINLQVDGRISANGLGSTTNYNGGGSGGSIWITANVIFGTGGLFADGGSGHLPLGGGGGGGRIAVFAPSQFSGTMSARGGPGYANGGAGTIYLRPTANSQPTLIVDNGGLSGANTLLDSGQLGELRILGGALALTSISGFNLTTLVISTNSTLRFGSVNTLLTVSSNADVSGLINLDALGGNQGTGQGTGGGGHGGYGGNGYAAGSSGGVAFDSTTAPSSPGGRAGQAFPPTWGGGALRMTVNGSLKLNGRISANGAAGIATNFISGGGAGGSLYLTIAGLSGGGSMTADGGMGAVSGAVRLGGGGGGGRIAVYYISNTFSGTFSARGGLGFMTGGAGTIYVKGQERFADLLIDNAGNRGTNSTIDITGDTFANLSILGGGSLTATNQPLSLSNLTVGLNSELLLGQLATITASGSVSIAPLGAISCDGVGNGPGPGQLFGLAASGGGHGGYGGAGNNVAGGSASDNPSTPVNPGGRGGNSGGFGGGAMRMMVTKVLQNDGVISANGANGSNSITSSAGSGGGAGGSVWLTVGGLAGSGLIAVNGGAGASAADGGGGGGRIAVTWLSNSFTGQYSMRGGAGFRYGGAGTAYLRATTNPIAQVIVDNGGPRGTNTAVMSFLNTFDLTVQGGGAATSITSPPRDLLVHSNGWVTQTGSLVVNRNATIEAGGGINLDGEGTDPSGAGGGLNSTTQAGGGGHGGYGGLHQNTQGGVYDSVTSPVRSGSAGGNGSGSTQAPFGGLGGGALHLTVGGATRVDGIISAAGLNGDSNSGGGSGGSLWLSLATLSGSGTVTARGGNGNNLGGGGGGGRIAIYYGTNTFAGAMSACGGSGYEAGGAGTIYLRRNNQPDYLLLDNCGLAGAATPLAQVYDLLSQNITAGNGAIGQFQGALPVLSNITVAAGGQLTGSASDTNLNLNLLGDLTVATGGVFQVDAIGFAPASGPGAGNSASSKGSGAGYGGFGGNSASGAAGGAPYGSGTLPVLRGSGGGLGYDGSVGGSQGGGAFRVLVGGQATIDGLLSANGGAGIQEDSGGGSGGSVLMLANELSGTGLIAVNGGDAELYGGGGGAGGRIALYSPANSFTGDFSMAGGMGAFNGHSGSLYISSVFPGLEVVGQTPSGIVSNSLNQIDIAFSSPLDHSTIDTNGNDVKIYTPSGVVVSPSTMTFSFPTESTLRIGLPYQNRPGDYRLEIGPNISDIIGQPMSQVYTGAFTISIPAIAGRITDTNGNPVSGVLLRQDNGVLSASSDATGAYVLGVDPGWSGNVVPFLGALTFVPATRSYTNLTASIIANQDYVAIASFAPTLGSSLQGGTNFLLNWFGIAGASYQCQSSTNLVDWLPCSDTIIGTNGPAEILVPIDGVPQRFFRVRASN